MSKLAEQIPALLRLARKRQGLTLQKMADRLNTTPQTISRLEVGDMTMSLEWLDRMLRVLDLHPSDLLSPRKVDEIRADVAKQITASMVFELRELADSVEQRFEIMLGKYDGTSAEHPGKRAGAAKGKGAGLDRQGDRRGAIADRGG
jgi:transcriptional regulator with XRE-family HTH domain